MRRAIGFLIFGVIAVFIKATVTSYYLFRGGHFADAFAGYVLGMTGGAIALTFLFNLLRYCNDESPDDKHKNK